MNRRPSGPVLPAPPAPAIPTARQIAELLEHTSPSTVEAELDAMRDVAGHMEGLDSAARRRVLDFTAAKYQANALPGADTIITWMIGLLHAINDHHQATPGEGSDADWKLWSILNGTRFEVVPPDASTEAGKS